MSSGPEGLLNGPGLLADGAGETGSPANPPFSGSNRQDGLSPEMNDDAGSVERPGAGQQR